MHGSSEASELAHERVASRAFPFCERPPPGVSGDRAEDAEGGGERRVERKHGGSPEAGPGFDVRNAQLGLGFVNMTVRFGAIGGLGV